MGAIAARTGRGVCVSNPTPTHSVCQTPPTVALALTVLKKLLCVQTHFAVTQLWL